MADIATTTTTSAQVGPAETGTAPAPTDALNPRDRLVITVLLISAFVVILNETIMGVAIPRLIIDLGIDASAAQWLTSGFMLTMAAVIPITGFLLQRLNTRPVFVTAMSLFSLGTLIAALAPGFGVLLIARIVQASGTAIMFPLLLTTVMTLVAPAFRGRMMGNISIVISVAPAIGPTISGLVLTMLDWRWMFIIILPIALTVLAVGGTLMKNVTTPSRTAIDVVSVVLSAVGFGGFVYGLSSLTTRFGWASVTVGAITLVIFGLRQRMLQRTDRALLDLRTFKSRTFTVSIIMMTISMMSLFGTLILLPIYTQTVLGLPSITVGLILLPGGLIMGLLAPSVGRVYDRIGPTLMLVSGATIVSAVFWGLTMVGSSTSMWWVLTAHVTLSIGLALLFTPLFTASLGAVPPHLYSHGSAIVGTIQQVAAAAGTALFVTVMAAVAVGASASGGSDVEATASGIRTAFLCGAIISVFAIPAAFFIRREPAGETSEHPAG